MLFSKKKKNEKFAEWLADLCSAKLFPTDTEQAAFLGYIPGDEKEIEFITFTQVEGNRYGIHCDFKHHKGELGAFEVKGVGLVFAGREKGTPYFQYACYLKVGDKEISLKDSRAEKGYMILKDKNNGGMTYYPAVI